METKHITGPESVEVMNSIQEHIKRMMIRKEDGPIKSAAAFCVVPVQNKVSGSIVSLPPTIVSYVYVLENGQHNTLIYNDVVSAAHTFIATVDRLGLNLPIDTWIDLRT